ncbi:MAG: formate/nitrite transporter family protein [Brachybacterium sp.]|nr:formate/nitrite transporter family protein [Brachybacterium sp.]
MTDAENSPVAPSPPDIAKSVEDGMQAKAETSWSTMFVRSLSGGAFIALGFMFFVTSQQGVGDGANGPTLVLGGVVFSLGLMLVMITGADLFTGSTMSSMSLLSGRLRLVPFFAHWGISLVGNLIGSFAVATLVLLAGTASSNDGAWGLAALEIAVGKVELGWFEAFVLGILANFVVCLAVVMANAGQTITDKILACIGPVALFVSTGLEHSVANMFILPMGLLIKHAGGDFWQSEAVAEAGITPGDVEALTVGAAAWGNLVPVVLGNIIGGAVLVGAYFWVAQRKPVRDADDDEA